jgi:hypothetical protein
MVKNDTGAKRCLKKPSDTVGELKSAEMCVSHMPALKAKNVGNVREKKYC